MEIVIIYSPCVIQNPPDTHYEQFSAQQIRLDCHVEFYVDENKILRDRLKVFTIACTVYIV